jgi:hypothetical protein
MNELERIQAREAYFEQYRKKVGELDETVKQHDRLNDQFNQMMSDCIEQRNYLKREIDAMRNIMTYMLDHGCDPVEAKLTLDDDNKKEHLWKKDDYNSGGYGSLGSLTVNTVTGTIGATGATGSYNITVPSSAFKTNYNLRP